MDSRTKQQIRQHYEIEKDLARLLLNAPQQERTRLAAAVYDELYRRVPHHPQHTQKNSPAAVADAVKTQMQLLQPFLQHCTTFLEIGPGDCALSLKVAAQVAQVYAVDVSSEITRMSVAPENFTLLLSDGRNIPLKNQSVDLAYSNQLMEHLHPDDAIEQLRNIYGVLAEGGIYLCVTPSRLTGPHDISKYFDEVASGFHLKEYSVRELHGLFKQAGFAKIHAMIGLSGKYMRVPVLFLMLLEKIISGLPKYSRKLVARTLPFRVFLNMIRIVGVK